MFVHELRRYLMSPRVSTSLCRIIFDSPKANGALLFMTILSTDPKVLKQWGYDSACPTAFYLPQMADLYVIPHKLIGFFRNRRPSAKRLRRLSTKRLRRLSAKKLRRWEWDKCFIHLLPEMTMHDTQTKFLITQTNVPLPSASTVIAVPGASKRLRLTSAIHELGRHLQRDRSGATSAQLTSAPPDGTFMLTQPSSSKETAQSPQKDPTITSLSNIGTSLATDISRFHLMFHCV